ncbi:MAG TPA: hypothetical protein VHJ20_00445 [Polyangia bacterium]|nr:hypothetical protein [Polyangia bacterium]
MQDQDPRAEAGTPAGARGASAAPEGPRRAKKKATSPDHRPPWLVVLSSLTLLYGGALLISSLDGLRHPPSAARLPMARALTPAEEAVAKQIADVGVRVAADHARALRTNAIASLPVGLVMLFAAASMLSRDRRGRALALISAWLGIAYQIVTACLTYPVLRDFARAGAPLYSQFLALGGGGEAAGAAATPNVVAQILVVSFAVTSALAIAGSAVVIGFFGGRKGRILYGLERAPGRR